MSEPLNRSARAGTMPPLEGTSGASQAKAPPSQTKQWKGALALWVCVVVMFLLVIGAWATIIKIASENPTERIEIGAPSDTHENQHEP